MLLAAAGVGSFVARMLFGASMGPDVWGFFTYTVSGICSLVSFLCLRLYCGQNLGGLGDEKGKGASFRRLAQHFLGAGVFTAALCALPLFPDGLDVFASLGGKHGLWIGCSFLIASVLLVGGVRGVGLWVSNWLTDRWQNSFGNFGRRTGFFVFSTLLMSVELVWLWVFPLFGFVTLFVPAPASWETQLNPPWVIVDPQTSAEDRERLSEKSAQELAKSLAKAISHFEGENLQARSSFSEQSLLSNKKIVLLPETFLNADPQKTRELATEFQALTSQHLWFGWRWQDQNLMSASGKDPLSGRILAGIVARKEIGVPFFETPFLGLKGDLVGDAPLVGSETSHAETGQEPNSSLEFQEESIPEWFWQTPEEGANALTASQMGFGKESLLICYEALSLSAWFKVNSKNVMVLTNHDSFARFKVLSWVYQSQLRWLGATFGKTLVLVSNRGLSGTFVSLLADEWGSLGTKQGSKDTKLPIQHIVIKEDWWK